MSLHVVDASVFGPLLFADERDGISGFEDLIQGGECIVPEHWRLELTNQLIVGARRSRTTAALARESLNMILDLPIMVDGETATYLPEILEIAARHVLTAYDAAYAELAIRADATLATFDKKLRAAALKLNIPLLP